MSKPYKTYWDLSEKERAALTDEQFKKYCQIELMEAGCAVLPDKPLDLILPPMEPLKTKVWFEVGGLLFGSMEDANTVIGMRPYEKEWVSGLGYDKHKAVPVTSIPKQIVCVDAEEASLRAAELEERRAKEQEHSKQVSEWNKLNQEVKSTLEAIHDDRLTIREKMYRYESIVSSLREYQELAGGDMEIARNFLKKRYEEDEIDAAVEWFADDKG